MSAILRYVDIVGDLVLNCHYSLQVNNKKFINSKKEKEKKEHTESPHKRECNTLIVFLKFFGSSWSSNGYAPTSIAYRVIPQDHTSANHEESNT